MKSVEPIIKSRYVEDLHHLRLMALLHDLVRQHRRKGAAKILGVDPRTLAKSIERGGLSRIMQVALEHALLKDGDPAAAKQREEMRALKERVDGLEQRVSSIEKDIHNALAGIRDAEVAEIMARLEGNARAFRELTRRLPKSEEGQGSSGRKSPLSRRLMKSRRKGPPTATHVIA